MGAWRYCPVCGQGLDYPQKPTEDKNCWACGADLVASVSTDEWIEDLMERVAHLEKAYYKN